jgi:flagellar hook-associated protein 2
MAAITSTGLGSGLDVNGIVTKLVAAERMSADTRNSKVEATDNAKITAYGTFKGALSDFKATVTSLSQSSNYQNITATSSDTAVVSASALSVADVGDYQLKVNTLAQSHALASKAYTEPTTIVGSGSLTVNFGTTVYDPVTKVYSGFTQSSTKSSLSLTIDSTNNTLVGIRDAINGAKAGVTASILNDGTGNRLVLKSNDTGVSNSIQVQVTEAGGAGLADLAFDGSTQSMLQTQAAENASVTINGLEVTSPSNTISSALKGVTFNLLQAKPSQVINININRNNDSLTTKLTTFVEKYNALTAAVKSVSSYDTVTKKGGILLGDYVLQSGMSQVKAAMTDMVEGVTGNLKTLTDVGIGLQKDGSLTFDKAKLSAAQASDIDAVTSLFAVIGRPTDANIQYIISTKDTQAGAFNIAISKAASQGALTTTALTFPLTVDSSNSNFSVKIDGVSSGTLALSQKSYASGDEFASEIQSKINSDSAIKANGSAVSVAYDAVTQKIAITSKIYGANSTVEVLDGSAALGLSAAIGVVGNDVEGTIDGVAAVGGGQFLTSNSGDSKGLKLLINDTVVGDRGQVNFGRGLIDRLSTTLDRLLATNGAIDSRTSSLQNELTNLAKSRTQLDARMAAYQRQLFAKFNAMDALMGTMQATSAYLTQQIAASTKSSSN